MPHSAPFPLSTLVDLLNTDAVNANAVPQLWTMLHPSVESAFEMANSLFGQFAEIIGESDFDVPAAKALAALARELGLSQEELKEKLVTLGPAISGHHHWRSLVSAQSRKLLLSLSWRYFRWAATDLRRLRVTAALGYVRQEAEALALMCLISDEPELGQSWLLAGVSEDGRRFFKRTQPLLKRVLRDLKLDTAYDDGSSQAQHVRLASAARGMWNMPRAIGVKDQDFEPTEPQVYLKAVVDFLRTQRLCLEALGSAFPEFQSTTWRQSVAVYAETIAVF